MDASQELKPLRDAVQSALVTVTRSANALANEDLQFQRTVHPSVATRLDQNTERLLQLAGGVLKSAAKLTGQHEPRLDDVDDVEINWKGIVDVIDSLLEKADTCLDEYTGLVKRKDAPTAEAGRDLKRPKSTTDRLDWSLKRANILKPQNAFEKKTRNSEPGPWKPVLTTKPHAQTPLQASLTTFTNEEGLAQYKHPYEHEITTMQYPAQVLESREPVNYLPIEKTKAIWVDTYEGVLEMLDELKKATEIAIDLEHHDFRTYTGLLSLMQISTREKDWIVDTLVPWRHKLEVLNEVFADPKILKVLHGAFMDTIWLQRDLGLYVVGLFDTFYACETLGYPGRSLAFLLKKFADFDADKKYQLADWRIRPLPKEMFYYARSDTHYLLYIYDMLRNELAGLTPENPADEAPISRVIHKSKDVSLQRYEHPFCDPETGVGNRGWYNTLIKSPTLYNGEQFAVYKAVHKWRDYVARRDDESPVFIMTQQVLSDIARIMPTDMKALWSLLEANARGLKPRLNELFDVVQEARERGVSGPTMLEFFRQSSTGTVQTSLGAKKVTSVVEIEAKPLSIEELKSNRSQLWGDVALNSVRDGSAKAPRMDYREMIPLYSFDFAAVKEELPKAEEAPPKARAEESKPPTPMEDEGFTLKGGRKRKASEDIETPVSVPESASDVEMDETPAAANEADEPPSEGSDPDPIERAKVQSKRSQKRELKRIQRQAKELIKQGKPEEAQQLLDAAKLDPVALSRASKKERKERKKRQHQQDQQQQESLPDDEAASEEEDDDADANDQQQPQQEDQPFDYTKAASVLHAARTNNANTNWNGTGGGKGGGKNGRRGKPAFDPYAKKSGDAPQGARKMNYERAGRTATFKK
ncbi:hypothetical protein C8A05DRAFT_31540 [Staphylotrichum tortipilum]|uniref:HRDC domain-containing protein n=1 Tax=Staphylotrichum tortipilum TaxID=2831512 RepID=A0AAN6MQN0_9PEZI|nr:hypothetical protein C8A05DRAFT_31540 [Staphylotrichum longicolle]